MKVRTIFRVLVPLLFLGVCATVAVIWASSSIRYSPSPDKESRFLQSYAPKQVIEAFAAKPYQGQREEGMASGGGHDSVTNERTIVPTFTMKPENSVALMLALRDDMAAQLTGFRAEILSESGDPQSGFHFKYRLGRSMGSATIPPVAARDWANRQASLPDGLQDVAVNIKIVETWFPTDEIAQQASLRER